MKDLCFIDTETTSLSAETGRIWEFAGIRRSAETGEETRLLFQIDVDLGEADPMSLKIGKYYERFDENKAVSDDWVAAKMISEFTRGTHLVGNCVSFDSERMERYLRDYGQCPGWHYHVIDIEPIILGYAAAKGDTFPRPYKSSDLSAYIDVAEPSDEERHTAMGDAEWVMRQWDAIFGF